MYKIEGLKKSIKSSEQEQSKKITSENIMRNDEIVINEIPDKCRNLKAIRTFLKNIDDYRVTQNEIVKDMGTCFCGQKLGEVHKSGCVSLYKNVKVRLTTEHTVQAPIYFLKEDVEKFICVLDNNAILNDFLCQIDDLSDEEIKDSFDSIEFECLDHDGDCNELN